MVRFQCPHCGAKLRVPETHAGKQGTCPRCKGKVTVPTAPEPELQLVQEKAPPSKPVSSQLLEDLSGPPLPRPVRNDSKTSRDPLDKTLLDLPPETEPPGPQAGPTDQATLPTGGMVRSGLQVLFYPISISGIIHLVIFSFLPTAWAPALTVQFWESSPIGPLIWLVLLTLYFLHYANACLSDSAAGATRAVDINSDSTPLSVDALLSTAVTVLPVVALIWGPPFGYFLIKGRVDWILLVWGAAAGLVFPMVILSVNYFDSVRGIYPVLVLSSMASVPGPYAVLVVCLSVLTASAALLLHLSVGFHGGFLMRVALVYVLLMEVNLLGRFYRRYQEQLNWGT